jgi:hypothetical protein
MELGILTPMTFVWRNGGSVCMGVMGVVVGSSGQGNSHDSLYADCQQKFYNSIRCGLTPLGASKAPPLVVGEASHAYAQTVIEAWMAGVRAFEDVRDEALAVYMGIYGHPDPDDFGMRERHELAMCVLPLWGLRQWKLMESGEEEPIGVELDLKLELPGESIYGPIAPHLRVYNGRIDYAFKRRDGLVAIKDHKFTSSTSPETEVKHYLMSDQHTGYVYLWNHNGAWARDKWPHDFGSTHLLDASEAAYVCYDFTRLQAKVTSAAAWWTEYRNVDDAQLKDWYTRLLARRADMTRKWDMPREAWISNTAPHGPCHKWGRDCEFKKLCVAPQERENRIGGGYEQQASN